MDILEDYRIKNVKNLIFDFKIKIVLDYVQRGALFH